MTNNKEKILRAPVAIMDMFKQANAIKVSSFFSDSLSVKVNTYLFTMHSTMTVAILSISMILVGMKQYFGEPIECLTHLSGSSALDKQQLQHYCWMEGAFTIYNPGKPKTSVPNKASQGIGSFRPEDGDSKMHHKYYQWVYYILCAQCVLFYIPKHMWRTREDNRLRTLIEKLKFHHILTLNNIEQYQIVQDTFDIIMTSGGYFWYLLFCEIVCFVHLVLQIWFLNLFLGGRFFFLGIQWLYYAHLADDVAHDPLIVSFPRVVKCEFHWYGPSGSVVNVDTICFMPLNIVNEKIFVTLWFWFILLGIVTVFHIFNRLVVILIPYYRYRQLRAWAPTANKRFLRKLTSRVGNWFVLMTIATNIRPYFFRDLMERILQDHWNDKTFKPDCKVFFRDYCNEEGKVAVPIDSKLDDYSPERKTVGEKQKKKKDKKSKDKTSPPDAGWNVNTNDNSNSNPGDNWNNSDNNDWSTQNNENSAGWDGNWGNS